MSVSSSLEELPDESSEELDPPVVFSGVSTGDFSARASVSAGRGEMRETTGEAGETSGGEEGRKGAWKSPMANKPGCLARTALSASFHPWVCC